VGKHAIKLTIHQADPRPLQRFHAAVLGFGKIDGPYLRPNRVNRDNHTAMWVWHAQNYEDVQYVIGWLWEFLSAPKREQIEHYMAIYDSQPHSTRLSRRTPD
jgi:hypothetical protein